MIRYETICIIFSWTMEKGYWVAILLSLINAIIMLRFSLTTLWLPWLFLTQLKMKLLPDFSWQHKPCVMFSLFQKYLITYLFKQSSILKVQDKICLENILYVSKPLNNLLLSVFHIWFSFSSDQHNYETSSHM